MIRLLPIVLVFVMAACSKGPAASASLSTQAAATSTQAAPPAPPKPMPAELPEVVARVNGVSIPKVEFEKAVKSIEARAGRPVPAEERDRVYRGVLEQLIAYRLLMQETAARKIEVPVGEVDARLGQIRQQYPSEDAFKQTLAQQGMSLEQLRVDAAGDMRVAKMLEAEVNSKVSVQPKEVTDFYAQNPDKFKQGERVRASHVLVRVPEGADGKAKEEARAKAAAVLAQVKAGGDFAELAKTHSADTGSAVQGGDLGFFQQGQMVGPFDKAAFSMKTGEISDLVETPFGFHIIKVVDRQAARAVPIDEVKPQIEQFLQNQQRQQKTQAFIESLKAKGKVDVLI